MRGVFDTVLICDCCGERVVVESNVVVAEVCGSGYECYCGDELDAVENDLNNPLRSPSTGFDSYATDHSRSRDRS